MVDFKPRLAVDNPTSLDDFWNPMGYCSDHITYTEDLAHMSILMYIVVH